MSQIRIAGPKNSAEYFDSNAAPTATPTPSHHAPLPVSSTLARKNSTKLEATRRSSTSAATIRTVVETSCASFGTMPRLSLAPHEQAGHRVIPDHAHQRTGSTREPPDRFLVVDRERHADIGEQADAAHQVEQ